MQNWNTYSFSSYFDKHNDKQMQNLFFIEFNEFEVQNTIDEISDQIMVKTTSK